MVNRAVNDARRENDRTKTRACNSCKIPLMPRACLEYRYRTIQIHSVPEHRTDMTYTSFFQINKCFYKFKYPESKHYL